jgi:hypothetical protein
MGYVLRLVGFAGLLLALVFWPALKRGFKDALPSGIRAADLAVLVPSPLLSLVARQCPVHRVTMHLGKVRLSYGLPVPDAEGTGYERERRALFPYAGDPVSAGCIPGKREQAVVWICPECQKAAAQWRARAKAHTFPRPDRHGL